MLFWFQWKYCRRFLSFGQHICGPHNDVNGIDLPSSLYHNAIKCCSMSKIVTHGKQPDTSNTYHNQYNNPRHNLITRAIHPLSSVPPTEQSSLTSDFLLSMMGTQACVRDTMRTRSLFARVIRSIKTKSNNRLSISLPHAPLGVLKILTYFPDNKKPCPTFLDEDDGWWFMWWNDRADQ